MKIDLYTKAVLTVIATALMLLVAQNLTAAANAQYSGPDHQFQFQNGALKVTICGGFGRNCTDVYSDGSLKVTNEK
jgi:hypothetical protein